jgi:uncharacterized peroxidase-related enzyme
MTVLPISNLEMVEESVATEDVTVFYGEIKRLLQIPIVPNFVKALAISPDALAIYSALNKAFRARITLPQSLTSMILYTIAKKSNCEYCSATHEVTCRTLGVDEETLAQLVEDLGAVNPLRVKAIIEFALKAAKHPKDLVAEDYEYVRDQGVSDEEIVEIILIAAVGVLSDVLAESLKIEVDTITRQALNQL